MPKIVMVGAGSTSFGFGSLCDLMTARDLLKGSTVALVDTNPDALGTIAAVATRMNEAFGSPFSIQVAADRCDALPDADFVIIAVAVRRNETWRKDFEIPLKHGFRQVLGENGGPGGLFHTMRNIPLILAICRDVERLCPNAWVLNFSNPEARLCLAATRYTNVRIVGLCHGIAMTQSVVGQTLGMAPDLVDPRAAGLNHFAWVLELRHGATGADLYPAFRAAVEEKDVRVAGTDAYRWTVELCRFLMRTYGLWPSPSDDHVGEYISYAWEYCGLDGYDFAAARARERARARLLGEIIDGLVAPEDVVTGKFRERAVPIIIGISGNTRGYELAVNIPNDGLVPNLPNWAVVEVPAVVDASGIHGMPVGPLPEPIAAMCRTQIAVMDRAVEAGTHGDRGAALQALLLDPVVGSSRQAEAILDELLAVHRDLLPQFVHL
jgi:alpha-galactosidase